jgi:hypothetical protein
MQKISLLFVAHAVLAAAACSGSNATVAPSSDGPLDASAGDGAASTPDSGDTTDGSPSDAGTSSVTFRYTPGWKGVTEVAVLGGFGQATDWTAPLVTLADDGSGSFTGAALVPAGQYLYVFKVSGDADAANPAQFVRYAVDPAAGAFAACPDQSPTFNKNDANPCSQITVPGDAPVPTYHIKGTVNLDGAPVAGYLVVVEREEMQSHHYFANRMNAGADGGFDLAVAQGRWRLQVLHPSLLKQNDAQRDPLANDGLRRAISAGIAISADATLDPVDVKYDGYAAMHPQGDAGALPTTFTFTVLADARAARVAVYGPANNVGDPWYTSPTATATSAAFDGGFDTKQAPDAGGVTPGTRYFWGTEQDLVHHDGGVAWTGQSMVFPITWQ